MTETTEPTREQIEEWIDRATRNAGLPAWVWQMIRDDTYTDWVVAVFRMALRTLDAEAKLAAMTAQSESYKTMALSAARRVRDIHAIVCGEDDSLSPREQHEAIVDVLRGHHALGPWTAAEADLARKIASDPCVVSKRWPGGGVEHARIVGEEAERAERSHRTLCGDSAQFLMRKAIPWIAAMTERADRLQRHFDEAAPEHNLPALLDLYAERERAATERAEKAERELTGAVLQTDVECAVKHELRAKLAEVERERDEEGRLCAERGVLYTNMVRQRDDWHGVAHAAAERAAVSNGLREAAEAERDALRAKLADAERLLAALADECERLRAENARLREAMPTDDERDAIELVSLGDDDSFERQFIREYLARLDAAKEVR